MDEARLPALSPSTALTVCVPETEAHRRLRENCRYYLLLTAAAGAGFAVCFTGSGGWGINFPVYFTLWCALAHTAASRLGLADARRERLWFGAVIVLSLSVFWTANGFVQFVSAVGIGIAQLLWALDLCASVRSWHLADAVSAATKLLWRALHRCIEPLRHLAASRTAAGRHWKQVALGLALAFPMTAVALSLMISADAAVRAMFARFSLSDGFWTGFRGVIWAVLVLDGFYALLCAQTADPVRSDRREARRFPTLVAVTFLAVLSALYVSFSAEQILVLFLRAGALPEGYTYAAYAREGFFELLALSALNVAGVIVSQLRFESSRILRVLLCVVSVCTFIMELSSAWRMILYVQAYGLTFLRLLVLWFLALLAVILTLTVVTVFRPGFRLFYASLLVCLGFWLVFAFSRPDAIAAKYDLDHFGLDYRTASLVMYDLSEDGTEALRPYLNSDFYDEQLDDYLLRTVPDRFRYAGLRGFNYSMYRANMTAEEYRHER